MNTNLSQKIPAHIFRSYDIRGIVDSELSEEAVYASARALGTLLHERNETSIYIGRDGRLSGPRLLKVLSQGLQDSGLNVINLGSISSPILYFACYTQHIQNGVMLTGSHNPKDHNGLKLVVQKTTLSEGDIQHLYQQAIAPEKWHVGHGSETHESINDAYANYIISDCKLSRPLKVVLDAGNGAGGPISQRILQAIGCELIPLYCDVDGNFPNHHPDPLVPENLNDLIDAVHEHQADCGLALDGDADRIGFVDNQGHIIWPDKQMMLLSEHILKKYPQRPIVFDVKCTEHLRKHIESCGGKAIMWRTGHSILKAKMLQEDAPLAGEMSGHIFFNDDRWFGFDDGLYAGIRLLNILADQTKTAHDLFETFPNSLHTPEIKITVPEQLKFEIVKQLKQDPSLTQYECHTIDGLRVHFPEGWGLVRASNTSAALTTRFEAETQAGLDAIKERFRQALLNIDPQLSIPF